MSFKLGISQKGLILISVPLAFELIFVSVLLVLLGNAERVADQEERSKVVISTADELVQHFYNAGSSLVAYSFARTPSSEQRFETACNAIPEEVDVLTRLAGANPQDREPLRRIQLLAPDGVELLRAAKRGMETRNKQLALVNVNDVREKLHAICDQLDGELKKIVAVERERQKLTPATKSQSRQLVRQALAAGIVLNILTAVGLAVFFARGIARRLRSVRDNTVKLASGQSLYPVIGGSDEITDLDKAFHQAAEQLAEAARKKQEFLDMISHDLRTPLAGLAITLGNVLNGTYGALSDRGQMRIKNSEQSLARLLVLVSDLLDIEKLESGNVTIKPTYTSLLAILQRSVEAVRAVAETGGITITIPEKDFEALADEMRISQVMVNLLSNAIKFSPAGTTIDLSMEEQPDSIAVRVSDQGRGIPAKYLDSIFDRYKQVELADATEKKGTGLGLAICKVIIEGHGGKIGVTSTEGKGSTFWFRLPKGC